MAGLTTIAQIKKFLFPETGKGRSPQVRVKLPPDINKEVVRLQADWEDNEDAPNKEQLLVAILRKGLNLPFQEL